MKITTAYLIGVAAILTACTTMSPERIEAYCSDSQHIKDFGSKERCVSIKQNQNKDIEEGNSPGQKFSRGLGTIMKSTGDALQRGPANSATCIDNGGGYYSCHDSNGNFYRCTQFGNTVRCD